MFAAYQILKRYEVRKHTGAVKRIRLTGPPSFVVVPRTGSFLERHPEVSSLQDLIRLLEALNLSACHVPDLRWADLKPPLPVGLQEIPVGDPGPTFTTGGKLSG